MGTNRIRNNFSNNPMPWITGIFGLIALLVVLYYLFKGIFWVLSWVAPVLLVATLIINYKVVLNYIQFVLGLFRTNILLGLLLSIFTFVGFPIVAAGLFFVAVSQRKVLKTFEGMSDRSGNSADNVEYSDYEEILKDVDDQLDLDDRQEKIKVNRKR